MSALPVNRGTRTVARARARGFVNPAFMILVAVFWTGVALVTSALMPLFRGETVSAWDWISLAAGSALIVGCIVWYVRWE